MKLVLCAACACAVLSGVARANFGITDSPTALPWRKAGVYVGGSLTSFDSSVRLGSEQIGAGLEVNLEDALDLDSSTQDLRIGGFWRFGETERHRVSLEYFSTKRTATKVLEEDVTIGDEDFQAGDTVSAESKFGIIKAAYDYSFLHDERIDLAASFGIYTMPMKFEFDGPDAADSEGQDFTAPLPVLGLHMDFAFTPELFLKQRVDLFYLEYGSFKGGLADIYVGLEWYPWEHFGFGLGLESFRVGIEADNDDAGGDLEGTVKLQQNGLFLYVTYAF